MLYESCWFCKPDSAQSSDWVRIGTVARVVCTWMSAYSAQSSDWVRIGTLDFLPAFVYAQKIAPSLRTG
jgi:hypothetical protein